MDNPEKVHSIFSFFVWVPAASTEFNLMNSDYYLELLFFSVHNGTYLSVDREVQTDLDDSNVSYCRLYLANNFIVEILNSLTRWAFNWRKCIALLSSLPCAEVLCKNGLSWFLNDFTKKTTLEVLKNPSNWDVCLTSIIIFGKLFCKGSRF